MWDMTIATGVGVLVAAVAWTYVRRRDLATASEEIAADDGTTANGGKATTDGEGTTAETEATDEREVTTNGAP